MPERRMLQNRVESAQNTFKKNQSPGHQPTRVRELGAKAIVPRSQLAAVGSGHTDGSADAGASLGQVYSVPKGTGGGLAHLHQAVRKNGAVCICTCLFAV